MRPLQSYEIIVIDPENRIRHSLQRNAQPGEIPGATISVALPLPGCAENNSFLVAELHRLTAAQQCRSKTVVSRSGA